jgi:hypothetical protein
MPMKLPAIALALVAAAGRVRVVNPRVDRA